MRTAQGSHTVVRIERDPGRTAHIALLSNDATGELSYVVATEGVYSGDKVESFRSGIPATLMEEMGGNIDPAILATRTVARGNCLPMFMIPVGTVVHSLSLRPTGPAKLCRSAGAHGRLVAKLEDKELAIVRLQSGEERYVSLNCCATIGVVSNAEHSMISLGKAGRRRWLGRRPRVRGLAMNADDHPHGGGRGKSKGNVPSQSKWGVLAKGYKTRFGKNVNKMKVKDRPRGSHA
ncbi:mitochondrial 54S ribosomal protein uL2m [Dipodascopsis tothii]|uniref:mitochondrial 54S ribosomal protein uL2m n=1 Tax=Dipodascopsis tothii TaxID=44089 RepID=UPI0034CE7E9A